MAVMALPERYRRRLRSTNGLERLNREVRRRERVIGIFPNVASALRLLGALLMEQDEEWTTGRCYLRMDEYWQWKKAKDEASGEKTTSEEIRLRRTGSPTRRKIYTTFRTWPMRIQEGL